MERGKYWSYINWVQINSTCKMSTATSHNMMHICAAWGCGLLSRSWCSCISAAQSNCCLQKEKVIRWSGLFNDNNIEWGAIVVLANTTRHAHKTNNTLTNCITSQLPPKLISVPAPILKKERGHSWLSLHWPKWPMVPHTRKNPKQNTAMYPK